MQLIFLVNMNGLFLRKKDEELLLLMHLKKKSKISEAKSKGRKPNEIWIDQGGEFYNNLYKRLLRINDIKMYSTCNK